MTRREAVGKMTCLILTYRQPIGFTDTGHAGVWLSEKARKEYKELDDFVTRIDNEPKHKRR